MADSKIYTIRINGLEQSTKAVDALSDSLSFLDKKIKDIENRTINLSTKSDDSSISKIVSVRQTEDKLLKQIQSTEQQIKDAQREEYQQLLASKDVLKEQVSIQKQRAASERLIANEYGNSMQGLKEQLSDIKEVLNTTDLSSDAFNELVQKANELNQKLKEVEEQYGQFGRNVGNYKSAADGFNKLKLSVNGVQREFSSAKEASRVLGNELKTMALQGKQNTEEYRELDKVFKQLQSSMKDVARSSTQMDMMLDTLESFVSIASVGKGLSSFFGIDNTKIEESIQKLVALQNILNGIEKLRLQMQTGEGIGKLLTKGNDAIDKFTNSLFRVKKAEEDITTATKTANVALKTTETTAKATATGFNLASVAAKTLSLALKGIGIGLVITGITLLIDKLSSLGEMFNTTSNKTKELDAEMNSLESSFKNRISELSSMHLSGIISDEEYLKKVYDAQAESIERTIKLLKERSNLSSDRSLLGTDVSTESNVKSNWLTIATKDIQNVKNEFKKLQASIKEGKDYFDKYGSGVVDWMKSLTQTVSDDEKALNRLGNVIVSNVLTNFQRLQTDFRNGRVSVDEYRKKIEELNRELSKDEVTNSVIANLDKYIPDEAVRSRVENIISSLRTLNNEMNAASSEQIHHWNQVRIDGMADGWAKQKAQIDENERYEIQQYGKTQEQIDLINKKYQRIRENARKQFNDKAVADAKEHNRKIIAAENDLNRLRIENMKDGLKKQLAQLQLEKNEKVRQINEEGVLVNERLLEINQLYQKKELEEKKKHFEELYKMYKDFWYNIYDVSLDTSDRILSLEVLADSNAIDKLNEKLMQMATSVTTKQNVNQQFIARTKIRNIPEYPNQVRTRQTDEELESKYSKEDINNAKEYIKLLGTIKQLNSELALLETEKINNDRQKNELADKLIKKQEELNELKVEYAKRGQKLTEAEEEHVAQLNEEVTFLEYQIQLLGDWDNAREDTIKNLKADIDGLIAQKEGLDANNSILSKIVGDLDNQGYSVSLSDAFNNLLAITQRYWAERLTLSKENLDKIAQAEEEAEQKQFEDEERRLNDWLNEQLRISEEWRDKSIEAMDELGMTEEEINKKHQENINRIYDEHAKAYETLQKTHSENQVKIEQDKIKKIKEEHALMYRDILTQFRDFSANILKLEQKATVNNVWGVNLKKTNENLRELQDSYERMSDQILNEKARLQQLLDKNEISFDDFQNANRELDSFSENIGEKMDEVKEKLSIGGQIQMIVQSYNQYFQIAMQSISTIMDAFAGLQDYEFDRQQEWLDKQNELVDKKLQEQEEIINKHTSNINDIESELATARGDRRQELIDRLNAEKAAEREALAEKKRAEKEKEKLEKEQEKLEKKRAEAEYKRNLANILISTAMATANGLATSPFIPVGIAMGALATSLGMVQYALAKKQKPYRLGGELDGGLVKGKLHSQGGIPVGNTGIEVEGNEYIINRNTTMLNRDLLGYINSKHKKIDLDDLIDFYGNGKRIKKSVNSVKKVYASGGQLPREFDIKEQLQNIVAVQDNREIVVSVVDIIDRQENVRAVRTLAGLSN